ncbi:hypothetical protein B2M27_22780 [Kluyvera intermedia]|uniref:Xylulose 5-phosphate/Fructose 6-phosphate phosphoketolase N-terminal domain-containing protein n=1 Tax=Kluyvera intermedia TaxID=61648 RepID=A0ABX3UAE8_KLUIN|nr:hypothetical protein B2M27_22780 [Kluyvera intermedia]
MNEGGELGYSLAHAFGAVFDNPALIAAVAPLSPGAAHTGVERGGFNGTTDTGSASAWPE